MTPQDSSDFVRPADGHTQEDINLVRILRNLVRYKLMATSIVVGTTLIAIVAALLMKPVYRSQVVLAPANPDDTQGGMGSFASQFGGLASLAGINIRNANPSNEALAILRSRGYTESFITEEGLMPVLFNKRWDGAKGTWKQEGGKKPPTLADGYQVFSTRIRTLEEDPRTGLVTLGIEWYDPQLAARWANSFVAHLNQYIRKRDIAEAQQSLKFLEQELEKSNAVELRQGIYRLIEHQIERQMLANVREDYAFRVLDRAVPSDPDKRERPNRTLMAVMGLALGLVFALLAVFFRSALDRGRPAVNS